MSGVFSYIADLMRQHDDLDTALRLADKYEERNSLFLPPEFTSPASVAIIDSDGTTSSVLADLLVMNDGNTYDVAEVTGAPGIHVQVTFSDLSRIRGIGTKAEYSGSSTHWIELQLYNYTTTDWDTFYTIENSNGQNYRYTEIPSDTDYLSSGAAIVRFYHTPSGNASHDLYIDYVAITE